MRSGVLDALPGSPGGEGAAFAFDLPAELEAGTPPELRGDGRDDVRMLVTSRSGHQPVHHHLRDLPALLDPGDLLVVNASQPLPVSIPVLHGDDAPPHRLHLATPLPDGDWIVEPRRISGHGTRELPVTHPAAWTLAGGAEAELTDRYGDLTAPPRLWRARLKYPGPFDEWLRPVGEPIRYAYSDEPWPLERYSTAFGTHPGSAESPSAGRPFTGRLLDLLHARGVQTAEIVLHCGVSTAPGPLPERYVVPSRTAALVNATHRWGGRVIAVGTTVVRALETTADRDGQVHQGRGWTELVIGRGHAPRAVHGLLTGWHEPASSHLDLLGAFADVDRLARSYRAALDGGYLWHEFGDLHLLLP